MSNHYVLSTCLVAEFPNIDWRLDRLIPTPRLNLPLDKINICKELRTTNTQLCFSWYPIEEATHYLVQWCYNDRFSGPSLREAIVTSDVIYYCLLFPDQVRQGETLYWRVQAANLEVGGVSNMSETRTVTYNCQSNNENPTLCDEFAVKIELDGPVQIDCCDKATFSARLNWTQYPEDHPLHLDLEDVDWTIKYDGGTVSTLTSPASDKVIINSVVDNPAKITANFSLEETQVVQITCRVSFTFPNSPTYANDTAVYPDFFCEEQLEVFADCADDIKVRVDPDDVIQDLRDNPTEAETEITADADYFLTGPVRQLRNVCKNDWQDLCNNCDCEYGKIAVELPDGSIHDLFIGVPLTFNHDACFTKNSDDVGDPTLASDSEVTITLSNTNYGNPPDCDAFSGEDETVIHQVQVDTPIQNDLKFINFDCRQCRCERFDLYFAEIGEDYEIIDGPTTLDLDVCNNGGLACGADSVRFEVLSVDPISCSDTDYTLNETEGADLHVTVQIEYLCDGEVAMTDLRILEVDGCFSSVEIPYIYSGAEGDFECALQGNFKLNFFNTIFNTPKTVYLACFSDCEGEDSIPIKFHRRPGRYQLETDEIAPYGCLFEQILGQIQVGLADETKTASEIFFLLDDRYVPLDFPTAEWNSLDFKLTGFNLSCEFPYVEAVVIVYDAQGEPVSVNEIPMVMSDYSTFAGTGTLNLAVGGATYEITITTSKVTSCSDSTQEARVNIPLGCHLTVDDNKGISVDVDSLVQRNLPEGREQYLQAREQGSCKVISPKVCSVVPIDTSRSEYNGTPLEGLELFSNSVHNVELESTISPGDTGWVRIVYSFPSRGERFVTKELKATNNTPITLSEGPAVAIVSQDCKINLISGASIRTSSAIQNIEEVSGTTGNSYNPDKLEPEARKGPISGCQGNCKWTANADLIWELVYDQCGTTSTTTPNPSTTTTTTSINPEYCEITTTPNPEDPCLCNPPDYCPEEEGECALVDCVKGVLDLDLDCVSTTSTTTTTTTGSGTTTTTTPCPDCVGTCTGYKTPIGTIIILDNQCDGIPYCECDTSEFGALSICTSSVGNCYRPAGTTTTNPGCGGDCEFIYSAVLGTWYLLDSDCSRSYNCTCFAPNDPGSECSLLTRPCYEYTTTTTTYNPCYPTTTTTSTTPSGTTTTTTSTTPAPDCDNRCKWLPNELLDGWEQSTDPEFQCYSTCPCLEPVPDPESECDVRFTRCSYDNATTTTENPLTNCCTYVRYELIGCEAVLPSGCTGGLNGQGTGTINLGVGVPCNCPRYGACCTEVSEGEFTCQDNVLQDDCGASNQTWSGVKTCQGLADDGDCGQTRACCIYDIDSGTGAYLFSGCDRLPEDDTSGCVDTASIHTELLDNGVCEDCPEFGACCGPAGCSDNVKEEDCSAIDEFFYPYNASNPRDCTYFEANYLVCAGTTTTTSTTTTSTTTTSTTPAPTGACCEDAVTCHDGVTEADCIAIYSGTYMGNGTSCGMIICPAGTPSP